MAALYSKLTYYCHNRGLDLHENDISTGYNIGLPVCASFGRIHLTDPCCSRRTGAYAVSGDGPGPGFSETFRLPANRQGSST